MNAARKYDIEKLLFRRQFILGPYFIEELDHWNNLMIGQKLYLSAHPELNVVHRAFADSSLTLLGYILNPNRPEADDGTIIDHLLRKMHAAEDISDIIQSTETLGGRWILIARFKDKWFLFNDPCGYRAVHYTAHPHGNDFWCASQPGLFPFVMNLNEDPEAIDYIDTSKYAHWGNKEYIFPGDSSIFKEIKHLLPNHYLNLISGEVKRHWPNKPLEAINLNDCIEESSRFLINTMQAAAKRFRLSLALTAGRDSRLILAASKKIAKEIHYFTGIYWNLNKKSPDIVIPAKLLSQLHLKHQDIQCPNQMNPSFARGYNANVTPAHQVYGTIAQGLYTHLPRDRVMLKGNAIPIVKGAYHSYRQNGDIPPSVFTQIMKVSDSLFAINAIVEWLHGTQNVLYNIDIMDLFQWEIQEGNWQAMSQMEWDLVTKEILVPYNNRYLLTLMLGVEKTHRMKPGYRLHEALIRKMWPELLAFPINPRTDNRKGIFSRGKTIMRLILQKSGFLR